LIFSFRDIEIRNLIEREEVGIEKFGTTIARVFYDRLADLLAFDYVSEIILGNPRPFEGSDTEMMFDIHDEWTIFFSSGHVEKPENSNGKTDWTRVSRIQMIKVLRK
jgi:hypothetical protein